MTVEHNKMQFNRKDIMRNPLGLDKKIAVCLALLPLSPLFGMGYSGDAWYALDALAFCFGALGLLPSGSAAQREKLPILLGFSLFLLMLSLIGCAVAVSGVSLDFWSVVAIMAAWNLLCCIDFALLGAASCSLMEGTGKHAFETNCDGDALTGCGVIGLACIAAYPALARVLHSISCSTLLDSSHIVAALHWDSIAVLLQGRDVFALMLEDRVAVQILGTLLAFSMTWIAANLCRGERDRNSFGVWAFLIGMMAIPISWQIAAYLALLPCFEYLTLAAAMGLFVGILIAASSLLLPGRLRVGVPLNGDTEDTNQPKSLATLFSDFGLSDRELCAVEQKLHGATSVQIADQMNLSSSTVRTYLSRSLAKMGLSCWEDVWLIPGVKDAISGAGEVAERCPDSTQGGPSANSVTIAWLLFAAVAAVLWLAKCLMLFVPQGMEFFPERVLGSLADMLPSAFSFGFAAFYYSRISGGTYRSNWCVHIDFPFIAPASLLISMGMIVPLAMLDGVRAAVVSFGTITGVVLLVLSGWLLASSQRLGRRVRDGGRSLLCVAACLIFGWAFTRDISLYSQIALLLNDAANAALGSVILLVFFLLSFCALIWTYRVQIVRADYREGACFDDDAKALLVSCGLSPLAADIVLCISRGESASEICLRLHVAPGTVNSARNRAYKIFNIHDARSLEAEIRSRIQG